MAIAEDKLSEALSGDFTHVGKLFAGSDGFAVRLFDRVEGFLGSDGLIEARTDGLTRTIELFAEQRASLNQRLESLESRLLRQFNALDSLVGQLSGISNFLTEQLANLPTVGKSR
jgi:flagellar hook-associated protein 2